MTSTFGVKHPDLVFRLHANPFDVDGPARARLTDARCPTRACAASQGPPSVIRVSFDLALEVRERVRVKRSVTGVVEPVERTNPGLTDPRLASLLSMGGEATETTNGTMSVSHGFVSMGSFLPVLAGRDDNAGSVWRGQPRATCDG